MTHCLMSAGALGAAVTAAREHGLLHALLDRSASVDELAEQLALDPWATHVVVDVLVANGVLDMAEEGLTLSPVVRRELLGPAGDRRRDSALWATAPGFLRTGATVISGGMAERDRVYTDVVQRLGDLFAPAAARLAAIVAPTLPRDARILDVGAGSGVWSLAILKHLPEARTIGLDLEHTVERFLERASAMDLRARAETLAGDFHVVTAPARSVDAIVFANVLHMETPTRAAAMIQQHARALRPGGQIIVVDALPRTEKSAPALAGYGLHLALRLKGARPHSVEALSTWLADAGLHSTRHAILEPDHLMGALIATR